MNEYESEEYAKCFLDPVHCLNDYGQVFDVEKKEIGPMTCFGYQEDVINEYHNSRNTIILKSRQTGLSVITAGYVAWRLCFNRDERILIVADDAAGAQRFLEAVKVFIYNFPDFITPDEIISDNTKQMIFSNGSWVRAVASSRNAGRGYSLTMLVLDETAFIEHSETIWMGAGLALAGTKGKCIMISTPNGTGNLYHSTWVAGVRTKNSGEPLGDEDFRTVEVHWKDHPIYSRKLEWREDEDGVKRPWSPWYEEERKRLLYDPVKIAQELDLSFEGSRALVFEQHIIEKYAQEIGNKKPECYFDFAADEPFTNKITGFFIWKKPKKNANYILGADVSRGDHKDSSTIEIIDADNLEQVAEFRGKPEPDKFADIIKKAADVYNTAYVAVECNSFGLATTLIIKNKLRYPANRMHHAKNITDMYNREYTLNVKKGAKIPGFQTTSRTRPAMITTLQKYMREGEVKIHSMRLVDELRNFIYIPMRNGAELRPRHADGFNDDLIFAFGIALLMRDTEFQNVFWNAEGAAALINAMSMDTKSYADRNVSNIAGADPRVDESTDVSWLYDSNTSQAAKEIRDENKNGDSDTYWPMLPITKG